MELRHLRYFIAVAEELNFTRAAEKLHMAQPPLSQQIQQLETQLGFQLFRRTKRTVVLTEAGQVFFEESQKILLQVDRASTSGKDSAFETPSQSCGAPPQHQYQDRKDFDPGNQFCPLNENR